MVSFVWTPALAVGFAEMDAQHQQLIALMGQLHDEAASQAPKGVFLGTLGELGDLTVRHFAEEERVMMAIDFPRFDQHKMLHIGLLERFMQYREDLEGPAGKFTPAFSSFLSGWLTSHIKGPDTQYGVFSGQLVRRSDAGPR